MNSFFFVETTKRRRRRKKKYPQKNYKQVTTFVSSIWYSYLIFCETINTFTAIICYTLCFFLYITLHKLCIVNNTVASILHILIFFFCFSLYLSGVSWVRNRLQHLFCSVCIRSKGHHGLIYKFLRKICFRSRVHQCESIFFFCCTYLTSNPFVFLYCCLVVHTSSII